MAITTTISTEEFKRISQLAYEGLPCTVSLHNNVSALTAENTLADWDAEKLLSENGYADFTVAALPVGGLDNGSDERWEIGETPGANTYIEAAFAAADSGFTYNSVVIRVGSGLYPHSILSEDPAITVAAGQTQTYRVQLLIDNI